MGVDGGSCHHSSRWAPHQGLPLVRGRALAHAALLLPCDADGMLKHLTEAKLKGGEKPSSPCSAGSSLFLRCRMPPTFGNTADERSPTPGSVVTNSRRRRRTCSSRAPSQRHHRPLQQPPSSFLWQERECRWWGDAGPPRLHRGGGSSQTAAAAWQAGRGPRKLW